MNFYLALADEFDVNCIMLLIAYANLRKIERIKLNNTFIRD